MELGVPRDRNSDAEDKSYNIQKDGSVIDLEAYAKAGKPPPKGSIYRIRVDKQHYEVRTSQITGRSILELAGKTPPERFRLDQKLRGGATQKIELSDMVDLTAPGVERFITLPLDQTEG